MPWHLKKIQKGKVRKGAESSDELIVLPQPPVSFLKKNYKKKN